MVYCKYGGNRCFRALNSLRRTRTICSPGRWLRISKHRRIFCHSNLSVRLEWYSSHPTSRWRRCSAAWKRSAYTASAANCSRAGLCRWNSLQRMKPACWKNCLLALASCLIFCFWNKKRFDRLVSIQDIFSRQYF